MNIFRSLSSHKVFITVIASLCIIGILSTGCASSGKKNKKKSKIDLCPSWGGDGK